MKRTHFTPHNHRPREFQPLDRVTHIVPSRNQFGVFVGYCQGYLSHAIVRWDGEVLERRVKVDHLSLVERPKPDDQV